jgi:hypothetical protein
MLFAALPNCVPVFQERARFLSSSQCADNVRSPHVESGKQLYSNIISLFLSINFFNCDCTTCYCEIVFSTSSSIDNHVVLLISSQGRILLRFKLTVEETQGFQVIRTFEVSLRQ